MPRHQMRAPCSTLDTALRYARYYAQASRVLDEAAKWHHADLPDRRKQHAALAWDCREIAGHLTEMAVELVRDAPPEQLSCWLRSSDLMVREFVVAHLERCDG
jgi:hypothetical protein